MLSGGRSSRFGVLSGTRSQLLNDLKVSRLRLGLLVSFGSYPKAEIKWMVL